MKKNFIISTLLCASTISAMQQQVPTNQLPNALVQLIQSKPDNHITLDLFNADDTLHSTVAIRPSALFCSTTLKDLIEDTDTRNHLKSNSCIDPALFKKYFFEYTPELSAIANTHNEQQKKHYKDALKNTLAMLSDQELYELTNVANHLDAPLLLEPALAIITERLNNNNSNMQQAALFDQLPSDLTKPLAQNLAQHALVYLKEQNIKLFKTLNNDPIVNFSLVAFSPDGQTLVSATSDNTVKLWNASSGQLINTLTGYTYFVNSVAFSPDGQTLAATSDNTVKLWNASTKQLIKTLTDHTRWATSVAFSPDSQMLASAASDNTVKLWNPNTGQLLKTLTDHTRCVNSVTFSPDGKILASAADDRTINLWNASSGQLIKTLTDHTRRVNSVAFSPDGQKLASAADDNTINLWNASSGQLIKTLTDHIGCVNSVAFSPDGQKLASAADDRTIKLWNPTTGRLLKTLTDHTGCVNSVVFSPDGQMLASAADDNTIKLWDLLTQSSYNFTLAQAYLLARAYKNNTSTMCSRCNKNAIAIYNTFDSAMQQFVQPIITSTPSCYWCEKNTKIMGFAIGALIGGLQLWRLTK